MIKLIFLTVLIFTASTYAQESTRCSCQHDFQDYLGNVSDVTLHALCPNYNDKNDLDCSATITNESFSATCANTITGEHVTTSMPMDPMTKPTYSYSDCRLN